MNRLFLLGVLLVVAVSASFGQIAYKMGDQNVNGFLGLGGLAGVYGDSDLPPLGVGYDFGYNENISIGGLVGYSSSTQPVGFGSWQFKYTYIIIGARGTYHYDLMHKDNIDTYGGIMIGYNIVSFSEENKPSGSLFNFSGSGSYLLYGGFIGGRYYFTPNLAAQLELGYGVGLLSIGISYKL
jgi:hypothetical protein